MTGRNDTSKSASKKDAPAIGPPPKEIDPYWPIKVANAKKIKEMARKARRGKPRVFQTHLRG